MPIVLLILCVIAVLTGARTRLVAENATQQHEAFILLVISAVFLVRALLIDANNGAQKKAQLSYGVATLDKKQKLLASGIEQIKKFNLGDTKRMP